MLQDWLMKFAQDSMDEEKSNRLNVLNNTYQKGVKGENLTGLSHLLETLSRRLSTKQAQKVLGNILTVLRRDISGNDTLFDTNIPAMGSLA